MARGNGVADRRVPTRLHLFWIMLVACVVLPTALFGHIAWRERAGYLARGIESTRQTTQILLEHALRVFEIDELAMDRLEARIAGLRRDPQRERELHDFIGGIVAAYDEMVTTGLLDDAGRIVVTGEYPTKPADVSDRDYVRAMYGDACLAPRRTIYCLPWTRTNPTSSS